MIGLFLGWLISTIIGATIVAIVTPNDLWIAVAIGFAFGYAGAQAGIDVERYFRG